MSKLEGQVAFITGAARGQGRAHAVRLAEDGADIIAVDICKQMESVVYPMSTREDLDETVRLAKDLGRNIVAREADVRDAKALRQAFDDGVAELGAATIVVANAGIGPGGAGHDQRAMILEHVRVDPGDGGLDAATLGLANGRDLQHRARDLQPGGGVEGRPEVLDLEGESRPNGVATGEDRVHPALGAGTCRLGDRPERDDSGQRDHHRPDR